jgi:hypothetical protein
MVIFADWNDGPLAHLPSGHFPANAAWLTPCRRHLQPDPRGRDPGRALPCESPRGDHPPPADQRRRPHRPPRPRPHHHPPARGLAPPARLDDPVRGRLRAARRHGLTRPDPVTAQPRPSADTRQQPRGEDPDKPQNTPAAGTPHPKRTPASSPLAATEIRRTNSLGGSRLIGRRWCVPRSHRGHPRSRARAAPQLPLTGRRPGLRVHCLLRAAGPRPNR